MGVCERKQSKLGKVNFESVETLKLELKVLQCYILTSAASVHILTDLRSNDHYVQFRKVNYLTLENLTFKLSSNYLKF